MYCLTICVNIHRQLVHLLVTAGREVLGLMVIARRSLAGPTTLLVREKILSWWSFTRLLLRIRNWSVTDYSVFKPVKNFVSHAMISRETPAKGCHWWRTHNGGPGQVWSDIKLTLDSFEILLLIILQVRYIQFARGTADQWLWRLWGTVAQVISQILGRNTNPSYWQMKYLLPFNNMRLAQA